MDPRITRRQSIKLSSKGLVALMTALPYLQGCNESEASNEPEFILASDRSNSPTGNTSQNTSHSYSPEQPQVTVSESDPAYAAQDSDESPMTRQGQGNDQPASESTPNMDTVDGPSQPRRGAEGVEPSSSLNWHSFLEQVESIAELQFGEAWDMETYVRDAAQLMQALDLNDPVVVEAFANYANQVRDFPEISPVYTSALFEVVTLEFEPGEEIGLHDHPDMTGVILCVSGYVEIDNFDEVGTQDADGSLLLRRSSKNTLQPGDVATLTADRGNIHSLRAPEFSKLLDVFTPPYNDDRSDRSRWFERESEPIPGMDGQTFRAWLAG